MAMFQFVLLIQTFPLIFSVEIKNFLPFGLEHDDLIFDGHQSEITDSIDLAVRYPFFNEYYDQLRVSSNGLILFGNQTNVTSIREPRRFPIEDLVCVAPYWIDTNLTNDSIEQIFYREILLKNEPEILYQITKLIRHAFPKLSTQRMLWAFVMTYYQIPHSLDRSSRNRYQVILTTNGYKSFTLLTYDQLEWSEGSSGIFSQVGFNAGDQIHFYQYPKSSTPAIQNLVHESNIGVKGQFVFHTTGEISDVLCETSPGLQVSPIRGSIYGGYEFRLYGICFNESSYEIHLDGQIINDCRILTSLYIVCLMPMLLDSGKISIELFHQDNHTLIDSTDFLAHVPEDHGELILKNYVNLTHQIADPHNDQLILQFQSNMITEKYLFLIIIYDYATQFSSDNQTLYNRTRERIDLGLGYMNLSSLGNLTIPYDRIFPVRNDPNDRVHALQISFEMKHKTTWFRKALFVGAKIFTAATSLHAAYCPAWLLIQRDPSEYIEQIPTCTCQIPVQPWPEEFLGFRIDEGCDPRQSIDQTCTYHQKARGCYRKKSDISWAGAQCCYDEQGHFIEHGKEGAGTLDLISPDANSWYEKSLSMFGHFFSDFLSYWSCCRTLLISEEMCKAYYEYRPAGRCEILENESIEQHGNSLFRTLNGDAYTLEEQGEFLFLSLPKLNEQQIQIRLSSNPTDSTIGISAFVIGFLKTKKRLQFELLPEYQLLEIRIDQRVIELPDEEFPVPVLIYEDEHLKIKRKVNGAFKISFPSCPFRFRVQIRPTFDFFDLETLLEREKFTKLSTPSFGLLGDLTGLMFPNGTRISVNQTDEQTLLEYANSWRISRNNSLFYYLFDQQPKETTRKKPHYDQISEEHCVESEVHHLYQTDQQHHWDSLIVTIEEDILPQTKSNNAAIHKYSFWICIFLLLF